MSLSDIMGRMGLAFWPQAALVIFLFVFAAVALRTFAARRKDEFERAAMLPLVDDDPPPQRHAFRDEGAEVPGRRGGSPSPRPLPAMPGRGCRGAPPTAGRIDTSTPSHGTLP